MPTHETPPTAPKHKKVTLLHRFFDLRNLSKIRYTISIQLVVFLLILSFSLLNCVYLLLMHLLEPVYSNHIQNHLEYKLHRIVSLIDSTEESGCCIATHTDDGLVLSDVMHTKLHSASINGSLDLSNLCIDISDTSFFYTVHSENVQPCILHNTIQPIFSAQSLENDNPPSKASTLLLRMQCFENGSVHRLISSGDTQQLLLGEVVESGNYAVLVSASLAPVSSATLVLRGLFPAVAMLLFIVCVIAAVAFSRWFTNPILELSNATQALGRGNYHYPLNIRRDDELGSLAIALKQAALQIERNEQFKQELISGTTHDLRTPLTIIKGYAETIQDISGDNPERRNAQLDIIINEADRLSALVNSVLEYSQLSYGSRSLHYTAFDLNELCADLCTYYEPLCEQNDYQLHYEPLHLDTPVAIRADEQLLQRALHNLLSNAIKHIGEDGFFALRITACDRGYRVEVQDHGKGIAPDDLPHIFKQYYRSRSDEGQEGTGLGLAIAKATFTLHHYDYGVESTLGEGATFWFIIPH